MHTRHPKVLVAVGFASILIVVLTAYLVVNYQPSEGVIRITYADGSVIVIGGRVPWRSPDATIGGASDTQERPPIIAQQRDEQGRYHNREVVKVEMWFRDKDARDRLKRAFTAISEMQQPGEATNSGER